MQFSEEDIHELSRRGLTVNDLVHQIHRFTRDLQQLRLEHACTAGDGITALSAAECNRLLGVYDSEHGRYVIQKFVPASGAASRMFKHLYNYNPKGVGHLTEEFILNFDRFPFVPKLKYQLLEKGKDLEVLKTEDRWGEIFDALLGPEGLNYSNYPKGLVDFHAYPHGVRTAFEEHLREALAYARNKDGSCEVHFTLSPSHVEEVIPFLRKKIEEELPYEDIRITYSVQSIESETIALDKNNEPARDENGALIFRPSGHGALIHNLGDLSADIIYVTNIDNITPDSQREETVFYKKILGGMLISLKSQVNHLVSSLEAGEKGSGQNALEFIQHWFQPGLPLGMNEEQLRLYARLRLDRPLRVCGMVRNEGEPGGGPFWTRMPDGHISKQIVEKSQVDPSDVQQMRILSEATHFNPVDMVCAIRDRHGNKYNLSNFIDYSTGFVSEKFHNGKVIKALELPGLWNGAMALWNTVFVEVPVSTFNPVKTVNDLLRPGHQQS